MQAKTKSLSTESAMSSSSSKGSDTQAAQQAQMMKLRPMGGSYSAASGSSSKIVDEWKPFDMSRGSRQQPRLAVVATALLKAKAEGQLPSALKVVRKETEAYATKLKAEENGSAVAGPPQNPLQAQVFEQQQQQQQEQQLQSGPQRPPRSSATASGGPSPPSPAPRRSQQQQQLQQQRYPNRG